MQPFAALRQPRKNSRPTISVGLGVQPCSVTQRPRFRSRFSLNSLEYFRPALCRLYRPRNKIEPRERARHVSGAVAIYDRQRPPRRYYGDTNKMRPPPPTESNNIHRYVGPMSGYTGDGTLAIRIVYNRLDKRFRI